MKILLCSSTFDAETHGPSKFARLIMALNDLDNEHTVDILTKDYQGISNPRIHVFQRKYPRLVGVFWEYWDNLIYRRNVREIVSKKAPDVVIFVDAVLGYLTARSVNDCPVIGLVNDDEYMRSTRARARMSKEWLIKSKSRILEKAACRAMDMVIANSKYISGALQDEYALADEQVQILYKGIDLTKWPFRGERRINRDAAISIVFVKSDFVRGGLFVLVEALNMIPDESFRLTVCGVSKEKYYRTNGHRIPHDHVELLFHGPCSQLQVRELMQTQDILCIPSLREGLGVANMEGMAVGIPVVSSDAGGIPEVLGDTGWICKAGDIHGLANTLQQCILMESRRNELIVMARKRVEKFFDSKKMRDHLIEILDEIVDTSNVS